MSKEKGRPSLTGDEQIDEVFYTCIEVMRGKSLDYSQILGSGDRLHNFRQAGEDMDMSMQKVLYIYLWKHLSAITVYCKTGKTESEGIRGRIVDAMNYLAILYKMTFEDGQQPIEIEVPSGLAVDASGAYVVPRGVRYSTAYWNGRNDRVSGVHEPLSDDESYMAGWNDGELDVNLY